MSRGLFGDGYCYALVAVLVHQWGWFVGWFVVYCMSEFCDLLAVARNVLIHTLVIKVCTEIILIARFKLF